MVCGTIGKTRLFKLSGLSLPDKAVQFPKETFPRWTSERVPAACGVRWSRPRLVLDTNVLIVAGRKKDNGATLRMIADVTAEQFLKVAIPWTVAEQAVAGKTSPPALKDFVQNVQNKCYKHMYILPKPFGMKASVEEAQS